MVVDRALQVGARPRDTPAMPTYRPDLARERYLGHVATPPRPGQLGSAEQHWSLIGAVPHLNELHR